MRQSASIGATETDFLFPAVSLVGRSMGILRSGLRPYVFVVGPMGKGKGVVGGVDIEHHIPNIRTALQRVCTRLESEHNISFDFSTPNDGRARDINEFVLPSIDRCDIGIADVSDRSPNVLYEIAYMHSLGIPVITFEINIHEGDNRAELPWYTRTRINNIIEEFSVEILTEEIYKDLEYLLVDEVDDAVYYNPISNVYGGIPLVDISAASGLAAGHFNNFLQWIIDDAGPFNENAYTSYMPFGEDNRRELEKLGLSKPESIIIVRPPNVQKLSSIRLELTKKLNLREINFRHQSKDRSVSIKRYKEFIIDFPDPIMSILHSPRYLKLLKNKKHKYSEIRHTLEKMEIKWIDAYFSIIEEFEIEKDNKLDGRLRIMTPEEIERL